MISWAANPQAEILINKNRSASNHYNYPYPREALPTLTAAPAGYEPFYIDHYGRHGSRWATHESSYRRPVEEMEKAERNGMLTETGEALLSQLREMRDASAGRIGELSDVGAEQHQGIARRMMQNFPEVFAGNAKVDARSTIVIRCILSMLNEVQELKGLNPQLQITTDASIHDMYYMGWGYGEDTCAVPIRNRMKIISDSIKWANIDSRRFEKQLFKDEKFAKDSIPGKKLMSNVFDLAGYLQDHHEFDGKDLYYLFTDEEIFQLWRLTNIYWYLNWGPSPVNGRRLPFIERALLNNMIESADEAIAKNERGASLRFGHETCVLPLACLLELDNVNYHTTDLADLHNHWQNYNIFPMACNVQMVFYRPVNGAGDVLVKVLLNEHEARLPIATTMFPYYRWSDFRKYYVEKLKTPIDWKN